MKTVKFTKSELDYSKYWGPTDNVDHSGEYVSLEDVEKMQKELIRKRNECGYCNGSGAAPFHHSDKCPICKGTGKV